MSEPPGATAQGWTQPWSRRSMARRSAARRHAHRRRDAEQPAGLVGGHAAPGRRRPGTGRPCRGSPRRGGAGRGRACRRDRRRGAARPGCARRGSRCGRAWDRGASLASESARRNASAHETPGRAGDVVEVLVGGEVLRVAELGIPGCRHGGVEGRRLRRREAELALQPPVLVLVPARRSRSRWPRGIGLGFPSGSSGQVRRIRLSCDTISCGTNARQLGIALRRQPAGQPRHHVLGGSAPRRTAPSSAAARRSGGRSSRGPGHAAPRCRPSSCTQCSSRPDAVALRSRRCRRASGWW